MISKLVLGTANFGLDYGIANKKKLDKEEVFDILDQARSYGIWGIDTARGYGDAEKVIGEYLAKHGKVFKIITKLPQKEYRSAKDVEEEVFLSMENLNASHIEGVLVHSFAEFKKYEDTILCGFKSLRDSGKIGQFGISVYHPGEMAYFLSKVTENVAIEFPVNLFDQRFLEGALLKRIKENGHSLFARSVFLQGLFFMEPAKLEGVFASIADRLIKMREAADHCSVKPECLALLFAIENPWIDGVLTGVDSQRHFLSNMECFSETNKDIFSQIGPLIKDWKVDDEDIILPYKWKN